jgi:hypothetical protein
MKKYSSKRTLGTLAAAMFLLAGCADMPDYFGRTPGQAHPRAVNTVGRDQVALREGIRLYHDGDFNAAIRKLSSRDIASGSLDTRVAALKYTAFSYCVTSRPTQCERAFDKALQLDPSFDLAPGEHGHPLWGPVFAKAKNER